MRVFRLTLMLLTIPLLLTSSMAAQQRPSPTVSTLPRDVLALACAPSMAYEEPPTPLRVTGGQDAGARKILGTSDLVTINAGMNNGIEVGQEFYVRRVQAANGYSVSREMPATILTAGWIKVWAIDDDMSLATVTHACDVIQIGDYLEPFALPTVPAPDSVIVKAQKGNYGRVLLGSDRRKVFARGDFFTVDRGTQHGVTPGMRFVVYRDKRMPENFLFELGEAVAVDVREAEATLQVILSRDAFMTGDYVAMRKE
jgi:hypothetical protein